MKTIALAILLAVVTAYIGVKFGFLIGVLTGISTVGLVILLDLIIKKPIYGLIVFIIALPFERVPSISLSGIDLRVNQVVAGLLIVGWVLSLFMKRKIRPNSLVPLFLLMIGSILVSLTNAGNLTRGIEVATFDLFMILFSIVITDEIRSKAILRLVIKGLIGVSIFLTIFALYQFAGDMVGLPRSLTFLKDIYTKMVFGFPRVHDFSMEPLYFANLLFIPVGILAASLLKSVKVGLSKRQSIILLIALMFIFALTLSRGAYLGMVVALIFLSISQAKQVISIKGLKVIVIIILLGLIGITSAKYISPTNYQKFANQALVKDYGQSESTVARLFAYDYAISAWKTSPAFGIGPGNFGPYMKGYPISSVGWDIVNNEYLEILAEFGLVGLIIYGLILITILWRSYLAYRKTKDDYLKTILLGLTFAFVGILVQYNFFSTFYIIHIWFLIGLTIAVQNLALIGESNE